MTLIMQQEAKYYTVRDEWEVENDYGLTDDQKESEITRLAHERDRLKVNAGDQNLLALVLKSRAIALTIDGSLYR